MDCKKLYKCANDILKNEILFITRPVLPSVEPGYLHELLPSEMPVGSENWREIMKDLDRFILPGLTHWQSPHFHAFYPSQTSFPSIVGEMLAAGLGEIFDFKLLSNNIQFWFFQAGVVGFNWVIFYKILWRLMFGNVEDHRRTFKWFMIKQECRKAITKNKTFWQRNKMVYGSKKLSFMAADVRLLRSVTLNIDQSLCDYLI